ncbi:superoxide dismutase [Pueribacillus theae]|uniref:superoxide dismutase n=2 Tax=Pueribacillus theae TaxID=2171751 RepID=A0A2U1JVM3_9BACI|nr:superoxide dismutase [Pueribacillus theae]PWA08873.1 superoxide dismutase [Pueribacillus theae]
MKVFNEANYLESLAEWCDNLNSNWEKRKDSYTEFLDRKTIEEWEENFQSFKKQLNENVREQSVEKIYKQANELYKKWETLNTESEAYQTKRHDDQHERKIGFFSFTHENTSVPPGKHTLPPLPYPYNALEPYISEEIMRLHHDKHHQSYVDGLNKAENEMQKARKTGDFNLITHWEREAAFNGAGHYLHTIFWNVMKPNSGGKPKGELAKAIDESFGSFEAFKKHFSEAAKQVEAVGWALLVWSPRSHRLEILQAEKHQNLSQWDVVPLLVLDVWEHAYYLQYKNKRADYVKNWWHIVNWYEVEKRFNEASKLKWQPF